MSSETDEHSTASTSESASEFSSDVDESDDSQDEEDEEDVEVGMSQPKLEPDLPPNDHDYFDVDFDVDAESESQEATPEDEPTSTEKQASTSSRSRFFVLGVCLLCLCLVGLILGLALGLSKKDNATNNASAPLETGSPATSPPSTLQPTLDPRKENVLEFLNSILDVSGEIYVDGTPANAAANWLLEQDPRSQGVDQTQQQLQMMDDLLELVDKDGISQRFLLALFYYTTSSVGTSPWLSCSPPPEATPLLETCDYHKPISNNGTWPPRLYRIIAGRTRWLSAAHECDWQGVTCKDQLGEEEQTVRVVTAMEIAGQELASFLVTEIMQLPSLTSLNVSFNYFRGSLPMDYSRLENLDLQFNQIASLIPLGFFANAPSLRLLNIGSNIFLGTIPSDVGKASNMQYLYIFKNLLGGQLPLSIYNLPLVEFQAQGNFLEGSLPLDSQSIFNNGWEMTLETLWLSDNRLVGSLPRALASFPNLRDLDVSGNDLVGAVPSELALLPSLESLKLGLNKFSGAIPDSLCTISSLRPLELEADCLPLDGPSNQCLCCTTCCDRTTVMCQPAPADISAIDGLLTP